MERKLLLTIRVKIRESYKIQGQKMDIVLIPFSGTAEGEDFHGEIMPDAVDTQKIPKGGKPLLSARYLLKGRDSQDNECQIFVENTGAFEDGFTSIIVTDSPVLSEWETAALTATVEPAEGGVCVRIFKEQ